jgi:hypothetical protein
MYIDPKSVHFCYTKNINNIIGEQITMASINKLDSTSKKWLLKKPWLIAIAVSVFIILLIVGAFIIDQKNATPNTAFTYDIPALIGKNIDQADKELPVTIGNTPEPPNNQSEPGGTKWHRIYMKDKHALIIDFNSITRKVIHFVLDGDNMEKTLRVGNLSKNDAKYKIEQLSDDAGMLGIRITPNIKDF